MARRPDRRASFTIALRGWHWPVLCQSLDGNLVELITGDTQFFSKVLLVLFSELVRSLELPGEICQVHGLLGRKLTFRFSLTPILGTDELSKDNHPFLCCESKTVRGFVDGSAT